MRMGKKMYNLLDADSNSTLNKIPGLKLKKLKAKSAKKFETEESATLEWKSHRRRDLTIRWKFVLIS
jgi:hypothetical protein